jgi:hypothetical protein
VVRPVTIVFFAVVSPIANCAGLKSCGVASKIGEVLAAIESS